MYRPVGSPGRFSLTLLFLIGCWFSSCGTCSSSLAEVFSPVRERDLEHYIRFLFTVPTFAVRETTSLGIRGAPEVPPLCRETSVSRTANVGTVGKNGLINDHQSAGVVGAYRHAAGEEEAGHEEPRQGTGQARPQR